MGGSTPSAPDNSAAISAANAQAAASQQQATDDEARWTAEQNQMNLNTDATNQITNNNLADSTAQFQAGQQRQTAQDVAQGQAAGVTGNLSGTKAANTVISDASNTAAQNDQMAAAKLAAASGSGTDLSSLLKKQSLSQSNVLGTGTGNNVNTVGNTTVGG